MVVEGSKAQPWNPDRLQLPLGHRILLKGHLEFQTARETKERRAQRMKVPLDLVQKPCHPQLPDCFFCLGCQPGPCQGWLGNVEICQRWHMDATSGFQSSGERKRPMRSNTKPLKYGQVPESQALGCFHQGALCFQILGGEKGRGDEEGSTSIGLSRVPS